MSNKQQLQTNNTALDFLITRVNAAKDVAASLPEAGSGGGASLETVTITYNTQPDPDSMIYYVDDTMNFHAAALSRGASYTVLKDSILVLSGAMDTRLEYCTAIVGNNMCRAFLVTG